jgi:hypothetical protein
VIHNLLQANLTVSLMILLGCSSISLDSNI